MTHVAPGLDGPTERASGWLCLRRGFHDGGTQRGAGWSGHAGGTEKRAVDPEKKDG